MKVGDKVTITGPTSEAGRLVPVVSVAGDYVYVKIPGHTRPRALHRRTGRARAGCWWLAESHRDPRAGRGTTK